MISHILDFLLLFFRKMLDSYFDHSDTLFFFFFFRKLLMTATGFELQSLKLQISSLLWAELLGIQATIQCGFTLKRIRGMIRTYSQRFWYLSLISFWSFSLFFYIYSPFLCIQKKCIKIFLVVILVFFIFLHHNFFHQNFLH